MPEMCRMAVGDVPEIVLRGGWKVPEIRRNCGLYAPEVTLFGGRKSETANAGKTPVWGLDDDDDGYDQPPLKTIVNIVKLECEMPRWFCKAASHSLFSTRWWRWWRTISRRVQVLVFSLVVVVSCHSVSHSLISTRRGFYCFSLLFLCSFWSF